jgi:hypothetical protein
MDTGTGRDVDSRVDRWKDPIRHRGEWRSELDRRRKPTSSRLGKPRHRKRAHTQKVTLPTQIGYIEHRIITQTGESYENVYYNTRLSNHDIIRFIRFVSRLCYEQSFILNSCH